MRTRAQWSLGLLLAVQSGQVAANSVPADMVGRMRGHKDTAVKELVAKVLPPVVAEAGVDWKLEVAEVEKKMKQGTGEAIFMERCAGCHKLFFKGGKVGPELTNYQRNNLSTMLTSIINPNAEIREGCQYYLVETKDGRSLSGFLVDRDTQVVVLRGLEGEDITLRVSEVKDMQAMGRSLMPEGWIDDLTDAQLRDFFAYMRISQPITR